jgi:uncharacterized phage-associated protein
MSFGSRPIDVPPSGLSLPTRVEEHLKDLFQSYGRLSAFELVLLSCEEAPWRDARGKLQPDQSSRAIIQKSAMKAYFKTKRHVKKAAAPDVQ